MMRHIKQLLRVFAVLSCSMFIYGLALAQTAPITIIVGAPPGGTTDLLARLLANDLTTRLNTTVVVENRAGAGGNIAAQAVAQAKPDGTTLLMSFTSHAINASLYKKLPFDPVKDFTPISIVSMSPSILVAHPGVPYKTIGELIAYAKQHPNELDFAVGAIGSSLHLAGDQFKMQAHVDITNIPYKGTSPAVQDLLAGHVPLMFAAIGNVQSQINAGKLIPLGVTSTQRLTLFPNVPTIAETLPGYDSQAWFGLLGPANMPPETLKIISEAVIQAVHTPEMAEKITSEGGTPVVSSPEEFSTFLNKEITRWADVVKFSGASAE